MEVQELLLALWPLLVFQLILSVAALISIARRGETRKLPRIAWVVIVIFVSTIGPILYFILGKGEAKDNDLYRD